MSGARGAALGRAETKCSKERKSGCARTQHGATPAARPLRDEDANTSELTPTRSDLHARWRVLFCPLERAGPPNLTKYPLARNSDGPGTARRQPAHRSHTRHPFHVDHASPNQPLTPIDQTTQHNPPKASMATRPRLAYRPTESLAQARARKPNPTLTCA